MERKVKRKFDDKKEKTKKSKCKYWDKCYRKNADHFEQFLHPKEKNTDINSTDDEEKTDAEAAKRHPKHKNIQVLLAHKYEEGFDANGWLVSEKLDGVRAFWDGKSFFSRLGNEFIAPKWFTKNFPSDITLDGELFAGRGQFQKTVSIVKNPGSERWKHVKYYIFDSPSMKEKFADRLKNLKDHMDKERNDRIVVVDHEVCVGEDDIRKRLEEVESLGGEGLMLRDPNSDYEPFRSKTLLKVKTFYDAEAIVIGYIAGKGNNTGKVGALLCKMECGKEFKVGSGLSDANRRKPPKKGSIITYKFQELTNSGSPRFPSFVGLRIDMDKPKDAVVKKKKIDLQDI